jgi:arsenate reductase
MSKQKKSKSALTNSLIKPYLKNFIILKELTMTKHTLYGLKNCDTCKKALKALEANGDEITFIDIRQDADLEAKVPHWLKQIGTEKLLNKRSTTWRNLSEAEQEGALTKQTESTLIANPTLIKRPVIETGKKVTAGWTKDVQEEHL